MKRPRKILFAIVLLAGGTAVGIVAAEIFCRIFLPPPPRMTVEKYDFGEFRSRAEAAPPQMAGKGVSGDYLFIDTPTGRRLRSNMNILVKSHWISGKDVIIRTNSIGYRNPEIGPRKFPRVLFLGDSITLADYVDEERTFVRLVEKLGLREGLRLETVNAGVGSVGIQDELAILLETGLGIAPDTVVLCLYLNDVQSSLGIRMLRTPPLLDSSYFLYYFLRSLSLFEVHSRSSLDLDAKIRMFDEWRKSAEASMKVDKSGDPLRSREAFNGLVLENFRDWGCSWTEGCWKNMEPVLEEFARQARIGGFKFCIVALPVRPQVEAGFLDDYPQAQLRKIAGKIDVPVLDLLPPLRQMWMKSREPLFYDQCHYTEYGNEAVAGLILAFLRENRLLGEVPDSSGADAQLPAGDPARRNAAEGK